MISINNIDFKLDLSANGTLQNLKDEIFVCNKCMREVDFMNLSDEDKIIRKETIMYVSLDRILGEGAADKIFKDVINPDICINVIKQFNKEIIKQYSNLKGIVIRFPIERRKLNKN
ncbi:hypothetical protein FDA33_09220 [Clostridium botulinum]|nr:hypothetical protein [Clostridium botulinum]NFI18082.1 hypothetical protein [Clostridium botulinum]NFL93048.1 hypothetical protein [Clostridium botulinum]NFN51623.1 hypothetical protein [Clostridium botulinum]NFO27247.1 hypothetical protein [Clostridium botulinum]